MPFGLCNAPGMLEHLMEQVLSGLYLDDILVLARTIENLRVVFPRLKAAEAKPKVHSVPEGSDVRM